VLIHQECDITCLIALVALNNIGDHAAIEFLKRRMAKVQAQNRGEGLLIAIGTCSVEITMGKAAEGEHVELFVVRAAVKPPCHEVCVAPLLKQSTRHHPDAACCGHAVICKFDAGSSYPAQIWKTRLVSIV